MQDGLRELQSQREVTPSEQNSKGNYIDRFDEYGHSLLHIAIGEHAGEKAARLTTLVALQATTRGAAL